MRMKRASRNVATLAMVLLLVLVAACAPAPEKITPAPTPTPPPKEVTPTPKPEPTPAMEWGIIEIRVTDPPPPEVESVVVHLWGIEVHKVSDNVGEWITIIEEPEPFDLLDVEVAPAVLGSANVTAGKYTQIRMDVENVTVVFVTDNTTDNVTADVPSGKLKIVKPFEVKDGWTTILTIDFEGEKSLKLPGKDIATGKERALFKPVIKLSVEYEEIVK